MDNTLSPFFSNFFFFFFFSHQHDTKAQSRDVSVRSLHIGDVDTLFLIVELFAWQKQTGSILKEIIIILSSMLLQCKMDVQTAIAFQCSL